MWDLAGAPLFIFDRRSTCGKQEDVILFFIDSVNVREILGHNYYDLVGQKRWEQYDFLRFRTVASNQTRYV